MKSASLSARLLRASGEVRQQKGGGQGGKNKAKAGGSLQKYRSISVFLAACDRSPCHRAGVNVTLHYPYRHTRLDESYALVNPSAMLAVQVKRKLGLKAVKTVDYEDGSLSCRESSAARLWVLPDTK